MYFCFFAEKKDTVSNNSMDLSVHKEGHDRKPPLQQLVETGHKQPKLERTFKPLVAKKPVANQQLKTEILFAIPLASSSLHPCTEYITAINPSNENKALMILVVIILKTKIS